MISINKFTIKSLYIILLLSLIFGVEKKSSKDIQEDIDNKTHSLNHLRSEIKKIEEKLIKTNIKAISTTEILIDLENKILLTEKLIQTLNREEKYIANEIQISEIQITKMDERLFNLKEKLKKRLLYLYINGRPSFLETILLSNDWNSAIYRIKYLNVLSDYEQDLRSEIKLVLSEIKSKREKRIKELEYKKSLLREREKENVNLSIDKANREKLLRDIKEDKINLEEEHDKKISIVTEMEKLIKKLYADKIASKKREEELERIRASQNLITKDNFENMKGKLLWPVNGYISSPFGQIRNPETGSYTENVGIDIQAPVGTKVKSILDGVVSTITYIRGHGNIVIVDHGGGFSTVYAKLDNILIKENEYIQMGNPIAVIAEPEDGGKSRIHFEIWGNQKKLNPEIWLMKK